MATGTVKFSTMIRDLASSRRKMEERTYSFTCPLCSKAARREGDKVSFEVGQDRKTGKSKAENVSVL